MRKFPGVQWNAKPKQNPINRIQNFIQSSDLNNTFQFIGLLIKLYKYKIKLKWLF